MGSEMCIRDSTCAERGNGKRGRDRRGKQRGAGHKATHAPQHTCTTLELGGNCERKLKRRPGRPRLPSPSLTKRVSPRSHPWVEVNSFSNRRPPHRPPTWWADPPVTKTPCGKASDEGLDHGSPRSPAGHRITCARSNGYCPKKLRTQYIPRSIGASPRSNRSSTVVGVRLQPDGSFRSPLESETFLGESEEAAGQEALK